MSPEQDMWRCRALIVALLAFGILLPILTGCSPTVKVVCPSLSPPPGSIVDALETTGRQDPSAAAWTIDLSKHYEKLDVCSQ